MRYPYWLCLSGLISTASSYYTMTTYAPFHPEIHGAVINARHAAFIIGAPKPSTHCGLDDKQRCPPGELTLINEDMTLLASEVPGGQFIYIAPDGNISYPQAHSNLRPPGSQMGGFTPYTIPTDCGTVLGWQSSEGYTGLWACPTKVPQRLVLKATMAGFVDVGCVAVDGVQIWAAGDAWGAWAYT